jgi:hypothetical protein
LKTYSIIDSNVLAIANELHDAAELLCVKAASDFLRNMTNDLNRIIVIDNLFAILNEYGAHCSPTSRQKMGFVFYKWIQRHKDSERVSKYLLPTNFEDDAELLPVCFAGFDRNDRKYLYLALQLKHKKPTVNYGIDRGYQRYAECFLNEGIILNELC